MKPFLFSLLFLITISSNVLFGQRLHRAEKPDLACIELDFCDTTCQSSFYSQLSQFKLSKGDFFAVTIKHINPYKYNIKITTKQDTITAGQEPALFAEFMAPASLASIAESIFTNVPGVSFGNTNALVENEIKSLFEKNKEKINRLKQELKEQASQIEREYTQIDSCYQSSVLNILNFQSDCFHEGKCFNKYSCECLKEDQKKHISKLLTYKKAMRKTIEELVILRGLGKDSSRLMDELNSKKYSQIYLNAIHAKTYSNFLIADNTTFLSTYRSFPIQVQGDMLELRIDITPKGGGGTGEKEEKENAGNQNTSANSQTVNIYTKDSGDTKASKPAASEPEEDIVAADELKTIALPTVREYHLNYKFRTNRFFYGFSSGFFIDNLKDEQYSNKPVDPADPSKGFMLLQEKKTIGKSGIMASVNTGIYLGRRNNAFLQLFAGPGLTFETKLQPRLLIGAGIGKGDRNKFSLNGGLIVGQIKRLSGIYNTNTTYSSSQSDLYYITNAYGWFLSVNYVFDLTK